MRVGEAGVAVSVREEMFNVVFEVLNYGWVCVELHYKGIAGGLLVLGGLGGKESQERYTVEKLLLGMSIPLKRRKLYLPYMSN